MLSFCRLSCRTLTALMPFFYSTQGLQAKPIDISLYVIADRASIKSDEEFYAKVEESIQGGATCIQWRDLTAGFEESLDIICRLQKITDRYGVSLIINSRLEEALETGADGVFLESKEISYESARAFLGDEMAISMPIETIEEAINANKNDIHHISIKIFSSTCASTNLVPIGIEGLRAIRSVYQGRILVIGGINLENLEMICQELQPGDGIALRGEPWRGNNTVETLSKMRAIIDKMGLGKE